MKTDNRIDDVENKDDAQDELVVDPEILDEGGGIVDVDVDDPVVLRAKVESLQKELEGARERYIRLIAESDNYRKRIVKEKEEYRKVTNEKLLMDILPVLDNLKRALDASRQANDVPKTFLDGIKMVEREFIRVLGEAGVKPVEPVPGVAFDPTIHEALHSVETEEQPPGTVVRYLQDGYFYNERLLRPALVLVASEPEKTVPEFFIDSMKLRDEAELEKELEPEQGVDQETDSE